MEWALQCYDAVSRISEMARMRFMSYEHDSWTESGCSDDSNLDNLISSL